ncbi:hypothetical protein PN441_04040 [Spirulina major CS-329]|uniref:hypothetical protein n=1 Tax=Spirulina TaxID=1154 RepID=UPI002330C1EF|nr:MULTISPECIES: hypothetical protein [Spirulina]MDB9494018.1 hypothetical protein [Spirulina subsalsa CS-330]MDB9502230.1 hypothetical protein [Spirulina major CS-329]
MKILVIGYYISLIAFGISNSFGISLQSEFSLMQVDPGDTLLNNYFMEHTFKFLFDPKYTARLWSPTFFYPYREVLAFSDNLFGTFPLYAMFRLISEPTVAFVLWEISLSILNFSSLTYILRKLKVHPILSGWGGFLFAFGMFRTAKINHPQLLPQFITPITVYMTWIFLKNPSIKILIYCLLLLYWQILSGVYLGWFLCFGTLIFLIATLTLSHEIRKKLFSFLRKDIKKIITIFLCWLILNLLTFFPYIKAKLILGSRSYDEVKLMIPRIQSWFSAPFESNWFQWIGWISKDLPARGEHFMFPGIIMTILSIFFLSLLIKSKKQNSKLDIQTACLSTFLIIFCLSMYWPFIDISLWHFVYIFIPGASVIRAVARIWSITHVYLIIGILVYLNSFLKNQNFCPKKLKYFLILGISILGVYEQSFFKLAHFQKEIWFKEVSEIVEIISASQCSSFYLYLNPQKPPFENHMLAMWSGLYSNIPTINGYSGNSPKSYQGDNQTMSVQELREWLFLINRNSYQNFIHGDVCLVKPKILQSFDSLELKNRVSEETMLVNTSENFLIYKLNK